MGFTLRVEYSNESLRTSHTFCSLKFYLNVPLHHKVHKSTVLRKQIDGNFLIFRLNYIPWKYQKNASFRTFSGPEQ